MKLTFLMITILLACNVSQADVLIPRPIKDKESATRTCGDKAAAAKFKSIQGNVIAGSSSGWDGSTISYKVERSEEGLEQTVCTVYGNYRTHAPETYSCTYEQSLNQKPLPQFKPIHRLG